MAADLAVRTEGLPALQLWDTIMQRPVQCQFREDNQAAIRVLETGRNPTMRHMGRTHKVDLAWLHERFTESEQIKLSYCPTDEQAADIFP